MEQQTREKIRSIFYCNCLKSPAIEVTVQSPKEFGVITTFLTLEYCCLSRAEYAAAIQRICDQLAPDGILIMGGVLEET
jgi:hypothetical protein